MGGINKQTSDPRLSPHYFFHKQAAQVAIQATEDFFYGKGWCSSLPTNVGLNQQKSLAKNPDYLGLSLFRTIHDHLKIGKVNLTGQGLEPETSISINVLQVLFHPSYQYQALN